MTSPKNVAAGGRHPNIKARNSFVDESLFGSARHSSPKSAASCGSASPSKTARGGSSGGSPALSAATAAPASPGKAGGLVLSKAQLDRMLQKSPIPTAAEQEQRRLAAEEKLEEELAAAKEARAAREAAAAAEAASIRAAEPKSEMERLREKERREAISRAQLVLLEEKEEVKQMNQMIHFSKCMATRDQQVAEKAAAKQAVAAEDARVAADMEQRRQAGLKELEEREQRRAVEQKRGALTILDQLADRERERAANEEQRRREGEEMKARIMRLREDEQRSEEERRAAARALLDEVAAGNAELAERKRQMKLAEVQEAAEIAEYIRQRDAREQELADERERQAKAKELEVARLRAMQEKILDNRSAEDEARARRYQDELELGQRRQAAAEQAKRHSMQRELEASRVEQLAWKQERREEEQRVERADCERILAVKRQKDEAEHQEEIAKLEARKRHQQRLLSQMDVRREVRGKEREELVQEGLRIRERLAQEKALLEAVKQLKLRELAASGVPEKYHAQLAKLQAKAPTKKQRVSQQPGIAAAFAVAAAAAAQPPPTDVPLEQRRSREQLERRLTEELSNQGDKLGPTTLRYLDAFRHLQQQAFQQGAAFEARHLELLVLILRSDVLHAIGDVSHQAYSLLCAYLHRFPYATLAPTGEAEGGEGRLLLLLDEGAAWQPLAAITDPSGLSRRYILEEAVKDAGHNYRLDHSSSSLLASGGRKKGGQLRTCLELLRLCAERAVDSIDEDHNGDVLLLRYLCSLLHQDLTARLAVAAAWADVGEEGVQRRRAALLRNSLLWRIWLDEQETDKTRQEVVRLLMKLVVGVASEAELQEVDGEQALAEEGAELAAPCCCTPRELAGTAATLLNLLLDLFGAAEAAGGFCGSGPHRMHRFNARLRLDRWMRELFWKNESESLCATDDMSRTFLAALAPAHRLRLLSLVAMSAVSDAYYAEQAGKLPLIARAKELGRLVREGDSGPFPASFPADPLVCLNLNRSRSLVVFSKASADTAANNLAVLACGIAQAAHSLVACGAELPEMEGVVATTAAAAAAGGGSAYAAGGGAGGGSGLRRLLAEVQQLLQWLALKHREVQSGERKEQRVLGLSRASVFDLLHTQAAIATM
ncbi:Cilia- and flagella-associated protein 45 [Chlorella vulgaris]